VTDTREAQGVENSDREGEGDQKNTEFRHKRKKKKPKYLTDNYV
jgi:hypothetical protein